MDEEPKQLPDWLTGDNGLWLFIIIALIAAIVRVSVNIVRSKKGEKIDWGMVAGETWDGLGLTIMLCIAISLGILIIINIF